MATMHIALSSRLYTFHVSTRTCALHYVTMSLWQVGATKSCFGWCCQLHAHNNPHRQENAEHKMPSFCAISKHASMRTTLKHSYVLPEKRRPSSTVHLTTDGDEAELRTISSSFTPSSEWQVSPHVLASGLKLKSFRLRASVSKSRRVSWKY